MALVEPPQRGAATPDSGSRHCRDDFIERHVGLLGDQLKQEFRMLIERRDTSAARFCFDASGRAPTLHPNHHHTGTDLVAFGYLAPRRPAFDRFNNPHTQILRIRLRHLVPPANQCARFAHCQTLGNPPKSTRFNSTGKRSKVPITPVVAARRMEACFGAGCATLRLTSSIVPRVSSTRDVADHQDHMNLLRTRCSLKRDCQQGVDLPAVDDDRLLGEQRLLLRIERDGILVAAGGKKHRFA